MSTVSELIRNYTRLYGFPRKPCGHQIIFSINEDKKCEDCERLKLEKKINENNS